MNQPAQSIKKTIKSQNRAQDRFAKLEMDFEDDSLKYKIPQDSLSNISTTVQRNNLIRKNNIRRLFLMTLQNLGRGFKAIYVNVFLTAFRAFQMSLVEIKTKLKKREENIQIKIDEILSMKEIQEKDHLEKITSVRLKRANDLSELESKINNIFHETVVTNEFKSDLELVEVTRYNMDFLFDQMSFIAKKISISNMVSNVQKISLVTTLDEYKMHTSLSIVLDKKGHVWSLMFGKHILPHLIKNYEVRNGIIKMNQMWDMTSDIDVLFLEFESETIVEILSSQESPIEMPAVVSFTERVI